MSSLINLMSNLAVWRITLSVFVFVAISFGSSVSSNQKVIVDAKFRGEWVPAKAACTSPLKLKLDSDLVTFINGSEKVEFKKLEQCYSCMGKDVENFVWLTTDAMGDSPFTVFLDGTKKKAAVSVDYNDKAMGKRFPFGKAELKKCK